MKRQRFLLFATLLMAVAAPSSSWAQAGKSRVFGELLKRIPEQGNVLMLVDVDGLFNSAMGKRENWREEVLAKQKGGFGLAPEISKVAVSVGMNFSTMDEQWKVGLVELRRDVPIKLEDLAIREGGYVETIENTPVAWTPRGFYLFDFPDKVVGFVSPTERKNLTTWFKSALWHPRVFPPGFADRAVFRADAGAQIVLALDLADSVSAKMIEPWLSTIDVIKKTNTDPKLLAPRLASVKSAFLVVKVDQGIDGNLRVDFDREIDYTIPVARALILDVLENFGAELPEMKTWTLSFDKKNAVEMSGRLSAESVSKILSMAHVPQLSAPGAAKDLAEAKATSKPEVPYTRSQPDDIKAAQGYFRSVASLIGGLKQVDRPTYRSTKLWYDKYAKQIEELPILGVDKDLLDWGSMVSRTMREMSSGINYYAKNQTYVLASTPAGGYGGYNYGYNAENRNFDQSVIKKQSDAMMSVDLDKRWQAVESSVADVRRKMVEKYMVDF